MYLQQSSVAVSTVKGPRIKKLAFFTHRYHLRSAMRTTWSMANIQPISQTTLMDHLPAT